MELWFYKKKRGRELTREDTVRRHCLQLERPPQDLNWLAPWSGPSSLYSCEKINFCYSNSPVYGILLCKHKPTNTLLLKQESTGYAEAESCHSDQLTPAAEGTSPNYSIVPVGRISSEQSWPEAGKWLRTPGWNGSKKSPPDGTAGFLARQHKAVEECLSGMSDSFGANKVSESISHFLSKFWSAVWKWLPPPLKCVLHTL